ncbi:Gfo/Idh/MocA family oxidoreductase [Blautia producta]|uniref:Gfo/Idh/MocA family oxidoreductase n=1 Tax=Blautia producta TaxID=33035 RepID=UPI0031B571D6
MIRVGVANIDISHPLVFADVMKREGRMQYVGVYNDSFRSDEEVEGMIARFGLEKRCSTLEELADMCDIGFIQGCNWADRLRCAMPFIEKGKPVFLDKPMVGSVADCRLLRELIKSGAKVVGSSSDRYAEEIRNFLAMDPGERGEIVTVYGTAGVDEFNYGIHIVEAIGGLMGQGAESVRYMGRADQGGQYSESYFVHFKDGRSAIYTNLTGTWQWFGIQILTTTGTWQLILDPVSTYDALLHEIANYMEGKPHLLADGEALLESIEIMLAGAASRENGGKSVRLDELNEDSPAFDGDAFWRGYRDASGPMYAL